MTKKRREKSPADRESLNRNTHREKRKKLLTQLLLSSRKPYRMREREKEIKKKKRLIASQGNKLLFTHNHRVFRSKRSIKIISLIKCYKKLLLLFINHLLL